FCGLIDHYIAGFFVAEQARGCGIGTALLQAIQADYPVLTLTVYQQNKVASSFISVTGL
ncbi:acetyltransferase, partial [Lacticaseibacillus rhamnosus MTCC 5462]